MWPLLRVVVAWVFGEDLIKWALSLGAGLLLAATCQSQAISHLVQSQPFGDHWLAGQATVPGAGSSPPASNQIVVAPPRAPAPQLTEPLPMVPMSTDRVARVISASLAWLGTPYLWGGCSKRGVDCSCFLQNIWATVGVNTPRTTTTQLPWTRPVPRDQIAAGDFLYWDNTCTGCGPNPTHVGMYLGDGRMIHCGDPCQIANINTTYWQSKWHSAGRVPA